ncbi:hypothetical protein Goklo_006863 [Gossypium klotzschianum]|uniref:Uncharacterized protein n=1 Tax=Gossypium klotzschianum TaxID=34286 RepID=A0A7J8VJM7_9ROSI|nr:hypothetical protein [Gossypium klotzschianum]
MKQCFYTGANEFEREDVLSKKPSKFNHQKKEHIGSKVTNLETVEVGSTLFDNSHDRKKNSWCRLDRAKTFDLCMNEKVTSKRKNCMENMEILYKPNYDENDNKRPRVDMRDLYVSILLHSKSPNSEQTNAPLQQILTTGNRQAERE